jgi:hypothetical protein
MYAASVIASAVERCRQRPLLATVRLEANAAHDNGITI